MNRHERRKAAAQRGRAGPTMTREQALAAMRAVLSPEHAHQLDTAPDEVKGDLVETLARGACTVAAAAEAWTLALDLYDAKERGEVNEDENRALMGALARRHRAALDAD